MRLTNAGKRLYEYASLQERNLEGFDFSVEQNSRNSPPLRFTTYDNFACGVLSGFAQRLSDGIKQISFFSGGPNSKILSDILNNKIDCALIAEPRALPGIKIQEVYKERYGVFGSPNLVKTPFVTTTELKKFKIITMPDAIAGANKTIDRLLWEIGLNSIINVSSYQVAAQLA
ncbi:MAG: LysR substrate-binding domain-containing protein [Pseudobdellovibrionaceae bacterium]